MHDDEMPMNDSEEIKDYLKRITDSLAPTAGATDRVGTDYVAEKLGCTKTNVARLVRIKEIPPKCVVHGTGNGRPIVFYRDRIDEWRKNRK